MPVAFSKQLELQMAFEVILRNSEGHGIKLSGAKMLCFYRHVTCSVAARTASLVPARANEATRRGGCEKSHWEEANDGSRRWTAFWQSHTERFPWKCDGILTSHENPQSFEWH